MKTLPPILPTLLFASTFLVGCGAVHPDTDSATATALTALHSTDSSVLKLSPDIPFDLQAKPPFTVEGLQPQFDQLSWQTFVAMNWPALPNGTPNRSRQIGQDKDNPTVWETWRESSTIFLPNGVPPAPWGTPAATSQPVPAACRALLQPGVRLLVQVGKKPGILTEAIQPFGTGPLIDQQGRYARFEILVNQSIFDTIFNQKLYSKQAQQSAGVAVFECGNTTTKSVGAIMVKAAWKLLSAEEKASKRFHSVQAVVYTPASQVPPISEKWELTTVGLVGLHVVHKTAGSPQWIWSTFEHVDNCPTDGIPADHPHYNFYRKGDAAMPINTPPDRPWDPNAIEPVGRRSQIVRLIPIDPPTQTLNRRWQTALRAVNPASVWQYYQLVGTQWPAAPAKGCDVASTAPANMSGAPAPQFLGNTTLESYIQGKTSNVSSSCIECHLNATTTSGGFSDFTYLLQRAQ